MSTKSCCVTGHRDIPTNKLVYVMGELEKEILQAVEDGYTHFISGFAEGTDLLFASIVVRLIENNPALSLEAAIPYRSRLNTTNELFYKMISACKIVGVHSEKYSPNCFMKRNQFMVSQAQRVIAVYDGRERGGTFYTIQYARKQGREIRIIPI